MAAGGAVEGGLRAEVSESVIDGESADGIVEGVGGAAGEKRIAVDGTDGVEAIGTGDGGTEDGGIDVIALPDAVYGAAVAEMMTDAEGGAAVITAKEIALEGLARTSGGWAEGKGAELDVEGSEGIDDGSGEVGIDGVDHLLEADAGAAADIAAIPVETEGDGGDIDLVAKHGKAVGRADLV